MEEVIISQQDLINAICLYTADRKGINPQDVQAELIYEDDYGFSAEVYTAGRKQVYVASNIIEAIRFWLEHEQGADPYGAALRLEMDEQLGIIAHCTY